MFFPIQVHRLRSMDARLKKKTSSKGNPSLIWIMYYISFMIMVDTFVKYILENSMTFCDVNSTAYMSI